MEKRKKGRRLKRNETTKILESILKDNFFPKKDVINSNRPLNNQNTEAQSYKTT